MPSILEVKQEAKMKKNFVTLCLSGENSRFLQQSQYLSVKRGSGSN